MGLRATRLCRKWAVSLMVISCSKNNNILTSTQKISKVAPMAVDLMQTTFEDGTDSVEVARNA